MILHRYFARRFVKLFLAILIVFSVFLALLDLVEQIRRFDGELAMEELLTMVLLNAPRGLYQILPLIVILAAIWLHLSLARSSELVVTRAAGRAGLAALAAPSLTAAAIGVLAVAILNPVVAATTKRYADLRELHDSGGLSTLSIGREGLWLRQGAADGTQTVIRAARANAEATELYDVSFLTYAAGGGPERRIVAERARLEGGHWRLEGAKSWPLSPGVNPEEAARSHAELRLPSTLTREAIRDSFGSPDAIPIYDLPAYIAQLEESGFSARRHMVWFQMELARPVFLLAMALVGAAFTMRHARLGRSGLGVLAAILLGFGLYYVRNFAQILGENGQVAPWIAAWAPPVASVLLALGLILHMEDG